VFAALAFVLALSGCSTRVIGGAGGSDPGEQTDEGDQGSTSEEAPNAVAMRFSQWPTPDSDPASLFNFSQLGAVSDPNSLVLFYSNQPQVCPQPFLELPDPTDCADLWQIILVIPSELAQPGVIDLQDQSIIEYRSVWQANCNGGGSGSGPGIVPGKLTITSIDATSVVTQLELDPSTGWEGESGNYTATFCP
jgi:hypothetical protein